MFKNLIYNIVALLVFLMSFFSLEGQNKLALVIGIGEYPADSGWTKIHGDNDIGIISNFLQKKGFDETNIKILENRKATKNNILKYFDQIAHMSKTGDLVYIHFSGHGQQITDLEKDEEDGYDEAWIPYDAKRYPEEGVYDGEKHLIDDEIYFLLKNIKTKIGALGCLFVVVDACHSGDSSRGEETESIRGACNKFIMLNNVQWPKKKHDAISWIQLNACKSYQSNYECKVDNVYYGSLSYALFSRCNDLKNVNLSSMYNILSKTMSELITKPQTLQLETTEPLSEYILFKDK